MTRDANGSDIKSDIQWWLDIMIGLGLRPKDSTTFDDVPESVKDGRLQLALDEVSAVADGKTVDFSSQWSRYPVGSHRPANVTALQKEAIQTFESKGWTHEQAIGIVASITAESGFDLHAVGDGGSAVALCQWHRDRQEKLVDFAQRAKRDPNKYPEFQGSDIHSVMEANLQQQLSMIHYELTEGGEKKAGHILQAQTSKEASAAVVTEYFERPANAAAKALERIDIADSIQKGLDQQPKLALGTLKAAPMTQTNPGDDRLRHAQGAQPSSRSLRIDPSASA